MKISLDAFINCEGGKIKGSNSKSLVVVVNLSIYAQPTFS